MVRYRFANVKCLCGTVVKTPRYGGSAKCFCGAELSTVYDEAHEKPMAEVPDDYPEKWLHNQPEIVGWTSK